MPSHDALELALLQLIRKGAGEWGWYDLALQLSNLDVPRSPDMMTVLKSMADRGWIIRHIMPNNPKDKWDLTQIGQDMLHKMEEDQRQNALTSSR